MRRLAVIVAAVLIPTFSQAWEIPDNPDRYPSIAVSGTTGDSEANSTNKVETDAFGLGFRFPFSRMATLDVDFSKQTDVVTTAAVGNRFKGDVFKATIRMYILPDAKLR